MPHKSKEAQRDYAKQWYQKNKEYKKAYIKKWREKNSDEVKAKAKEYMRKYNKKYWHSIPEEKKIARRTVKNLVKSGEYKYYPCIICGSGKTEFHHPDYKKPKFVVSVCRQCHRKIHKNSATITASR
jgi:hypothetical protein